MIAVFSAWALSFVRDRGGLVFTLALPALVYLLFAAIFGAGVRGEVSAVVGLHDQVRSARSEVVARALETRVADRLVEVADGEALERAVVEGRVDVGVRITAGPDGPQVTVLTPSSGGPAGGAVAAALEPVAAALAGERPAQARVLRRPVGPQGDMQAVYYAGAVSVMFMFFAAMHGGLAAIDERRSGLQHRLTLAARGVGPVVLGRLAFLAAVGVLQSAIVFGVALARMPPVDMAQVAAGLVTATLTGAVAAGAALALAAACRSREQAQPLSTFVALILAALGGSMAPRFLMPEALRLVGLVTPHAWAIEAHQRVFWLGRIDGGVVAAWAMLGGMALALAALALILERRRA